MTAGDASRATVFQTRLMSGNWLPKIKLEVRVKMSWTAANVGELPIIKCIRRLLLVHVLCGREILEDRAG